MTQQHTPGPWFHSCDEGNRWCNVNTADRVVVDGGREGVRESDMRLIAAAPDLLAALKTALLSMSADHAIIAARAIAAAEGREEVK